MSRLKWACWTPATTLAKQWKSWSNPIKNTTLRDTEGSIPLSCPVLCSVSPQIKFCIEIIFCLDSPALFNYLYCLYYFFSCYVYKATISFPVGLTAKVLSWKCMESSTTFRQWWISNAVIYKRYFGNTVHTVVNLLKCKEKNGSIQCNTSGTHFDIALNHTQTWSYTDCHKRIGYDKFCEQYIKYKAQKASHFHSTSLKKLAWFLFSLIFNKLPRVFFSFPSKYSFLKHHPLVFSFHIPMDRYSYLRISHSWQKLAALLFARREAKDWNGMALLPHKCDHIQWISRPGKYIVFHWVTSTLYVFCG